MAQIVNDAIPARPQTDKAEEPKTIPESTKDPREGLDRAGVLALLARTRKSIYEHAKLDILYRMHQPLTEIQELSKTSIVKHVVAHNAYWSTLHDRMQTFDGMDTMHPLFNNNGTIPMAKNVNGYGFYVVPITDRRKPEFGEEPDPNDYSVVSSILHIADPFWGTCMTKDVCQQMYDDLMEYITLGIYPLITIPKSYEGQMDDAEKFEFVCYDESVGIIINVQMETVVGEDGKETCHLYGVVLWSPKYTAEYSANMYGCFSGTLQMVAVRPLTSSWSPINEVSNIMARGNPVFEYRPNTMVLQTISDNHELQDLIDSALGTGQLTLGFVDHLLQRMKNMSEELANITQQAPVTPEPQPEPEEEIPTYEEKSEIPVEDASEIDAVGRRMRLYDSEADDGDVEPIYNAFRIDTDYYD